MQRYLFTILTFIFLCSGAGAYELGTQTRIPVGAGSFIAVNGKHDIAAIVSQTNQNLSIVDTNTGAVTFQLPLASLPTGVVINNGDIIVSSRSGQIWIYNKGGEITAMVNTDAAINSIAVIDNQRVLAAFSDTVKVVDTSNGTIQEIIRLRGTNPRLYGSTDKIILTEAVDGITGIVVYDKKTGLMSTTDISGNITSIGFDEEFGYVLATMSGKTAVSLYDVNTFVSIGEIETNKLIANLSVNSSTHTAVVASLADGSMLVVGVESKLVEKTYPFFDSVVETTVDTARNIALVALSTDIATVKLENPIPVLHSVTPDNIVAGSDSLQVSISGQKLLKDTDTHLNGKSVGKLFNSNEQLTTDILPDDLIYPGSVTVSATNPSPGGGTSNHLVLKIVTPIPQVSSISPTMVESKVTSAVRAMGKNFLPTAQVAIDGTVANTYFVSSAVLEARVDATMVATEGTRKITVINTGETVATSNTITLTVATTAEVLAAQAAATAPGNLQKGSLRGLILNTKKEPLANVTVSYKNNSVKTMADGSFVLGNIPEGRRTLLIDGSTATGTGNYYPAIPVTAIITANAVTQLSFTPHLHKQKSQNFTAINSAIDTVVSDPDMKGYELLIPKGVRIVGWDGRVNDKVSMRTVPPDRLPIRPVPENSNVRAVTMFYFDKIGGGRPDRPVPFKSPNTLRLKPGEKATLWYYDESSNDEEAPNDWAIAGTGTVSKDGRYIITDEGVGIPKFCCGATAWGGLPDDLDIPAPNGHCGTLGGETGTSAEGNYGAETCGGDPVNAASGYFYHNEVDMVIPGIIPVKIKRYYVNRLGGSAVGGTGGTGLGAFGKGWAFEYDWRVDTYDNVIRLKIPGGTFFDFALPDGLCIYALNKVTPAENFSAIMYAGLTDSNIASDAPDSLNYPFMVAEEGGGSPGGGSGSPVCTTPGVAGVYRNSTNPEFMGAKITIENGLRVLTTRDGWRYVFETAGGLISLSDRNGNTITVTRHFNAFDPVGYIAKVTNAEGQDIIFNQTADGVYFVKTNSIVAPDGRTVTYIYETDPFSPVYPRLKKVITPDGTSVQYGYDSEGRINTLTDRNGVTKFVNIYDSNHRVVSQTAADGSVTTFNYTLAGGRVTQTDMTEPNGAVTTWRFNSSNYISDYTTPEGTTTYTMSQGSNFITGVTDPLNRTLNYTFYDYFMTGVIYPFHGRVSSITDPQNNTTNFTYENRFGMNSSVTNAVNNTMTVAYVFDGDKITQTTSSDALNHSTIATYNSFGLPVTITDPNGNISTITYDVGKPSQITAVTDALGNAVSFAYDASGRVKSITDAKGAKSSFKYDAANRIIAETDARGNSTNYEYDNNGNLKVLTDVKGNITTYQYDGLNRLTKRTDRLGRSELYVYYNGSGNTPTTGTNLKSYTDKRGVVTSFDSYDLMNRLTHVTFGDGATIQITYDTVGRPTSIADSISGTISFTYDVLNRFVSETTSAGTINYTYDAIGRRTSMTAGSEPTVTYGYDSGNRPVGISRLVGGILRDYVMGYDNGNRRVSLQIPLATAGDKIATSYGFDVANRLQNIGNLTPAGILEAIGYTSDQNGNRDSMSRSVTFPQAAVMAGTAYNEEYEMLAYNGNTLTYDENGNVTSKTDANGNVTIYVWDARNRLVSISAPTATPSLSASFQYDALGRRISKAVNGVTTTYVYDGADIIRETTNDVTSNYVRTLGVDEPLSKIDDAGTVRHYVRDGLGSIVGQVDDTGSQVSQVIYDAYGMTSSLESFGFTGREKDDGTGLMFYRARYYSPEMRRFVSRDPIGFSAGDANFYGYVRQNPVNFTDASGENPMLIGAGFGAVFGGVNGFLTGIRQGSVKAGIIGGLAGGLVGGAVGAIVPAQAPAIAAIAANMTIGGISGAFGGAASAYIAKTNGWTGALNGGIVGAFTGAIGGSASIAIARLGGSPVASNIGNFIATPFDLGGNLVVDQMQCQK